MVVGEGVGVKANSAAWEEARRRKREGGRLWVPTALLGTWPTTAESYFALMKRGVHGVFHHVSKPQRFDQGGLG
jgi:hypothetical protein